MSINQVPIQEAKFLSDSFEEEYGSAITDGLNQYYAGFYTKAPAKYLEMAP